MTVIDTTWNWRQLSPTTPPTGRASHSICWDGTRVLMFGGVTDGPTFLNDTWELVGDEWNELSPTHSPTARAGQQMVWDGSKVIMMGGIGGSGYTDQTWKYQAADWTQITSVATTFPTPIEHVMCWDTINSRVLAQMWSGNVPTTHDTYSFTDGSGDWTLLTPAGELPDSNLILYRFGAWCDDRFLVASGDDAPSGSNRQNDINTFTTTWTTVVANSNATSYSAPSTYPRRREAAGVWTGDQLFFYGGADGPGANNVTFVLGDQYLYDKVSHDVTPIVFTDNPPRFYRHEMVWTGERVVLFGGEANTTASSPVNQTWVLEPPTPLGEGYSIRAVVGL